MANLTDARVTGKTTALAARLSASPTPKFQRRFGSRCILTRRQCVPFRSHCGSEQQQALRGCVRNLLALVRRPPMVTLLPQIVLPAPQLGNDLTQFSHKHIGRCVVFYWPSLGRCVGERL
jgi:hypothetical protein